MSVGFRIKDASGNVVIDSTETTALLQEKIVKTSLVTGSKTFTTLTNVTPYAVGLCESSSSSAGTWSGVRFGISNSVVSGHPKVNWAMSCTSHFFGGGCGEWNKFHVFVFMK